MGKGVEGTGEVGDGLVAALSYLGVGAEVYGVPSQAPPATIESIAERDCRNWATTPSIGWTKSALKCTSVATCGAGVRQVSARVAGRWGHNSI